MNEEDGGSCDDANKRTEFDGLDVETELQEMFGVGIVKMLEIQNDLCAMQ